MFRLALPAATLLAGFLATNGPVFATKEMAKAEKKPCTACHEKGTPTKTNLNADGKKYQQNMKKAPEKK
jgi:cytochrome c551/c552